MTRAWHPGTMTVAVTMAFAAAAGALDAQAVGTNQPSTGRSNSNVGLSAATFLQLPVGARETALGGAAVATTHGLAALFWNTAASSDVTQLGGVLSYSDLFGGSGLSQRAGAIAFPIGGTTVGLALNQFSSGEIVRTTEQFPEGGDPAFGGTYRWSGIETGLHLARRLTDRLSVGGAAKYVYEGSNFASASWVVADVSTLFATGLYGTTLGASVRNLGGASRFGGRDVRRTIDESRDAFPVSRDVNVELYMQNVSVPVSVQFALSTEIIGSASSLLANRGTQHGLVANLAFQDTDDRTIQPVVGVEYRFRDAFFLRGGKRFYTPDDGPWSMRYGLAGGFGIALPVLDRRASVDYAATYLTSNDLPLSHVFTFHLGQ